MPDPTTVKAVGDAASYISVQSDRWLFVALLLVFLLAVAWMARWFMAREESMRNEMKGMQSRIDAQGDKFNDFLQTRHAQMMPIIEKNTAVVTEAVATLHTAAELLKIAADSIERRKSP